MPHSTHNNRYCFRHWALLMFFVLSAFSCGCNSVHRRMTINSDPPNALVLVDGEEVGYTPATVDFTWYGTREITIIKDGYETLTTMQKVKTPIYQWFGADFVTENLSPFKITDRHAFNYRLQPQRQSGTNEILDRANNLRSQSQIGE